MFKNAYQRGLLTVFFSAGSNPLCLWDTHVKNGYMKRFLDQELKALVFEIGGTNVSTTYMTCPKGKKVLGIIMPFMIMMVKNLKKYFTFEVTILDDGGSRRKFRVANFQSSTLIRPFCTVMPIGLADGWNQIQFNLADFTKRAYNRQFIEVQNLKINANICLRRIYFAEKLITDDELPTEYRLYLPLSSKGKTKRTSKIDKENVAPSTSKQLVEVQRLPSEEKRNGQESPKRNSQNSKPESPKRNSQEELKPQSSQRNSQWSLPESLKRVTKEQFFADMNVIPGEASLLGDIGSNLKVLKGTPTVSRIQSKEATLMQKVLSVQYVPIVASKSSRRSKENVNAVRYGNTSVGEFSTEANTPVIDEQKSIAQTDDPYTGTGQPSKFTEESELIAISEEELENV